MEAITHRPTWKTLLAFAIIYFVWGCTFFAIRVGVREVPPFLLALDNHHIIARNGNAFTFWLRLCRAM